MPSSLSSLLAYQKGWLELEDGTKSYLIVGDGPTPVVVVPGAGDGIRTPADVGPYVAWFLRQRSDEYRILVLGRREPIPRGYSVEAHAEDMIATVDELDWGPAYWECLSAGGPIGQQVAVRRPDLVLGLILTSSLHHTTGRMRTLLKQWLLTPWEANSASAMFGMIEHKFRPPNEVLTPEQLAEAEAVSEIEYPARLWRILQPLVDLDQRELLGEIRCPTLVLSGAKDRFVPAKLQQDMARRIPDCRQEICAGYGHFHDLDNPDYHRLVEGFIDEQNSKR